MQVRVFENKDTEAVVRLWSTTGLTRPWNDPRKDIERKIRFQPELFFVGEMSGEIVASVMAGYEGHRGWINYLAVSPEHQRKGYGNVLMERAEKELLKLGCPKINLQVRAGNASVLGFYAAIGYGDDEVMGLGKRLIKD